MELLEGNWVQLGLEAYLEIIGAKPIMFNESMGIKDSNEVEIFSIRRALEIWKDYGQGDLEIEGDSANALKWAKELRRPP